MKKNKKLKLLLICLALIFTVFLGNIYASNAKKGELNGDDEINYADVSLLQLHLAHIQNLSEDKLDLADMNNDKEITITDLNILIKKIEKKLVYEVHILDMKSSNYYPNENEDIIISFNADINYDGKIASVILNNKKYNVAINEETGLYEIKLNVGNIFGIHEYKITEVTLKEGQTVGVNSSVKIDVLKEIPTVTDYVVTEDLNNSKLNISFTINDPELSFEPDSYYEIMEATDETENANESGEIIATHALNVGVNNIEVSVEKNKKYKLLMHISYNLDSDALKNDEDHFGRITQEYFIELVEKYNFKLSNINTYRYINNAFEKTNEFYKNESIIIRFNSTNVTDFIPVSAVINGNTYEIIEQEDIDKYAITIDGLETLGNNTLNIEQLILDNGKVIDTDESITVKITKNVPSLPSRTARQILEENTIEFMFSLKDTDKTITKLIAKLFDENDKEIAVVDLTNSLSNQTSRDNITISTKFDITNYLMLNKYKIKVFTDYTLLEDDENYVYSNKEISQIELNALPVVKITNVTVSNKYPEKNENIILTYKFETNKESLNLDRIVVNNLRCIPIKNVDEEGNVSYSVIMGVGEQAGILNLNTTEFVFEGSLRTFVSNTVKVDVLKDKPTSEDFTQIDDIKNRSVTLTANIVDSDKAFINGDVKLVKNSTGEIVATKTFDAENVTFTITDLELNTAYTLVTKMTYDRDTNTLEEETNKNYVEDEIFSTRPIQLIENYELKLNNITTYNEQNETKYFAKNENIILEFTSSNHTNFYPVKVFVNGEWYELQKYELEGPESRYRAILPGYSDDGAQDIVINKVMLDNTIELEISKKNSVQVETLKNIPTVSRFSYEEEDNTIVIKFTVNDEDDAITGGNVIITDEKGTELKKETLSKDLSEISFTKTSSKDYIIKIIADYDLDINTISTGENEHKNQELLVENINISQNRLFEVKDVTGITLYKNGTERIEEVTALREADLTNLSNYIAKIKTKNTPDFYAEIDDYRIEDNKLVFILKYKDGVHYENGKKQNNVKVTYGSFDGTVAQNRSIKDLINEIKANPTGAITLKQDYDASDIQNSDIALVTTNFTGTLDGNGHKITGLSKPLFDSISSATIKNLVLEDVNLSGANSKGTLANIGTNVTAQNVHIDNLNLQSGANQTAGFIGTLTGGTIEKCSVTNLNIVTAGHVRIAGIVGYMAGGTIKDCYVQGTMNSTQTKDGNGIGSILGHGTGTAIITIENCISKVDYTWTGGGPRLNGGIIGLSDKSNAVLKNNVSLSTGEVINKITGSAIGSASANNYELEESTLVSNANGNIIKTVAKENLTKDFFVNNAQFNESVWNLEDVSYDNPPCLKSAPNKTQVVEQDAQLYIPEYDRIKDIAGFDKSKEIAYHNIQQLMPYYDSKYLVSDGAKIANDSLLNTKIIKHILPYSEGKLLTTLTTENCNTITSIKVVFTDTEMQEYNVTFKEIKQNIAIYQIPDLDLMYAYDNYVLNANANIVTTIAEYINAIDYTNDLDPLTSAGDSRLYKDHYNETIKPLATHIALQLLQNEELYTLDNAILNNIIKEKLIDSGKLKQILYAYNYFYRWYNFEIGGSKVSDLLLFEGKMFKDTATLDNLVKEVFAGNIATNNTAGFFNSNVGKHTGSSALAYFLDYIIINIGEYENVNDWFTEYFSAKGVLSEIPAENHPEVKYRAWDRMKSQPNFILPLTTLPENAGYIISGPAHLQVGAQRVYTQNPNTQAGHNEVKNKVNAHSQLVKRYFDTLSGTFDVGKWNNYTIMCYDTAKTITGTKTNYLPGTNVPLGTTYTYAINKAGTSEPFHKNFNEAVGKWEDPNNWGGAAGVGNMYNASLWFLSTPGCTNFDTWTHEFQHALGDKILIFSKGMRFKYEGYAQGVMEQRKAWSENNYTNGVDVGVGYFNLVFNLGKESMATQNLTPERIDTREKLENYYKGQQNAIDLLDYVSAKAFLKLTPEEQAKVSTRITESGNSSSWEKINAEEAKDMNLTTLESLWENKIILRPENAWGISVRGLIAPTSMSGNDYGCESIWVTRWYITHNDSSYSNVYGSKRNMFEMLGYGGVDAFVTYASRQSNSDLDAIQKITLAKTGTAMNWKEYKMSRYATIESAKDNKYVNMDLMIDQFVTALKADANNSNANLASSTNLRKIYYHYLKRTTNDFVADPLGTDIEMTHITTAQELITEINNRPYGYYILDNDIDFTDVTSSVTQTFMGTLDGNGHKIIGNSNCIFNKIRFGSVKNLKFEGTNIPKNVSNIAILSNQTQYSILENIEVTDISMNFAGREDLALIAGSNQSVSHTNCTVEHTTTKIKSVEDFAKLQEDPGGIFTIEADIDFTGYTTNDSSVVMATFTGKIEGNNHKILNLNNASLFANFRGTIENLNIENFTNEGTGDFRAAFAAQTYTATLRNMNFKNITLSGENNVAVVTGMDGRENANSVFENISVKNANVTGTGVYVSTFIGRKFGGTIKNVYVQGTLTINSTENGGLIGALQQSGTIENVITDVSINKTHNTYSNTAACEYNGSIFGNIYNTPKIKNCIAFGNMTGYTNNEEELLPFKFTGAAENQVNACLTNCYEVTEETGFSRVTDNTAGKLNTVSRENLNKEFYNNLGFDETIWNLDSLTAKGYPEKK